MRPSSSKLYVALKIEVSGLSEAITATLHHTKSQNAAFLTLNLDLRGRRYNKSHQSEPKYCLKLAVLSNLFLTYHSAIRRSRFELLTASINKLKVKLYLFFIKHNSMKTCNPAVSGRWHWMGGSD